jgi:adenine-specific DNA-methyltransferase
MPVFDDLKAKLQELFMFDRADLDFGMYRILNAKRAEVTRFLETELLPSARAALGSVTAEDQARLKAAVETAREQARKFGAPDPDATPGVQEAKAAYGAAADTATLEEEIYSHLLTFFSRYYHEGDFIPQRRYSAAGRERYMIPYDGEEVKLVWANMEQYYIKSGESLTDYAFTFADPAAPTGSKKRVEFRLVVATEETANNKSQTGERRFALADLAAHPPSVSADGSTLTLAFTYVEHPKGTKQAELLDSAEVALAKATLPALFASQLAAADSTYSGKSARTVLRKHLEVYAAKNTYDYFIHKDLGGFLRRELDYFIKTEVLRLDDLLPEDPAAARRQLQKVHALKKLAGQIIAFLEQIENFQKKLWLKKKFVTEVRYCLTLDRIPETFYDEIAANAAQREEWKALYHIQAIPADTTGQPGYPGDKKPLTVEFLQANPFLMVDTGHFSADFAARLVAAIPMLDESLGGVCFHSENFQALEFILGKYKNGLEAIYIDPPYNTDASPIMYKNGFKESTFASLISDRVSLGRSLLLNEGALCAAIDDIEFAHLRELLESVFGVHNLQGVATVRTNPAGRSTPTGFSIAHDYAIFVSNSPDSQVGRLTRTAKQLARYDGEDDIGRYEWVNFRKHGGVEAKRSARPKMFYPFYLDETTVRVPKMTWSDAKQEWLINEKPLDTETVVWPVNDKDQELRWKWGIESVRKNLKDFRPGTEQSGGKGVYFKSRMDSEGVLPLTWWDKKEYSATEYGTNLLKDMFGDVGLFSTPKSIHTVADCLRVLGLEDGTVLDYFGGSATTGHAALSLNREDQGQRRYILVEMGEYFETVLVPRLKKVVYSTEWKDGEPIRRDTGISHAFKIIKLESYEDTLNNLRLPARSAEQTLALEASTPEARADYLLSYSLELEIKGSPSLLDLQKFSAPWSYQLSIHRHGEMRPVTVDLVETFNWLLGLRVEQQDAPVTLTADFETDAADRAVVKKGSLRKAAAGWTFQAVTGRDRAGRLHLVLWRSLAGDAVKDNAVLDAFFQKQGYNARDTEFDTIYVNGDNNLANLALAADTPDAPSAYKVKLIESEFHRLMWDVRDV